MTDNLEYLEIIGDAYDSGEILKRCVLFSEGPIAMIIAKLSLIEAVEDEKRPPNFD